MDIEKLPDEFKDFGSGLHFFAECVTETRLLAEALAKGNLSVKTPTSENEIAAPLKSLHASLKHLTWQAQQVAKGDYKQRVEFMGELSASVNVMINQLEDRQKKLEAAVESAKEASKAKTNFLAMVSHEIRSPMNAILGIAESQLIKENLDTEYKGALNIIYSAGSTLLTIINDVLDVSKIEADKIELTCEKYELASMIYNVVTMNTAKFSNKPIEFILSVDEHLPSTLYGDELRLKQILNNVLSNAFKYTNEGTIKFSVFIEKRAAGRAGTYKKDNDKQKKHLLLIVSDTGIGMSTEDVDRIFDEYARFNLEANRKTQGTGLGMHITNKLVALMDGEISVESEVYKGTTISICLPQGDTGAEPMGKEAAERLERFREINPATLTKVYTLRTPMPYGSVLIVDDDEMNLFVANALLAPYKLSIETAKSGFAAIEKIKSGKVYDIVFMDYMMPEMDGIETTKNIRGYGYSLPMIVLTADAITGRSEMFLKSGFDEFISKPIDMRRMDVLLKRFILDKDSCASKTYCSPVCNFTAEGKCSLRQSGLP
ncbi:MAG: ATP-binding protein [Spirochaetes bacterium]|nr:ATP-binding protein [Spirochaetota bacterium]